MGITRLFRREIPPEQRDFESFAESKPWLRPDAAREQYLALVTQAVKAKKPIHLNGQELLERISSSPTCSEEVQSAMTILDDEQQYLTKGSLMISREQFERDARIKTLGLASAGVALATIGLAGLALTYAPSFNKKPAARQNLTQSSPVRQKPITEQSIFQKEPIWTTNQPNYFLTANEPKPVETNSPTATVPREIIPSLRQSTIPESATQTIRQLYTQTEPREILPPLRKHEMPATNSQTYPSRMPEPLPPIKTRVGERPLVVSTNYAQTQKQPLKKQDKPKAKPQPQRQPVQPSRLETDIRLLAKTKVNGRYLEFYSSSNPDRYTPQLKIKDGTNTFSLERISGSELPGYLRPLSRVKAGITNTNLPSDEMPLFAGGGYEVKMAEVRVGSNTFYILKDETDSRSFRLAEKDGSRVSSDKNGKAYLLPMGKIFPGVFAYKR